MFIKKRANCLEVLVVFPGGFMIPDFVPAHHVVRMNPQRCGFGAQEHMTPAESIRKTIRDNGPISFRDYMFYALYDPGMGYYCKDTARPGTLGDFYTSPCYTPLFGEMIALQLEEMWKILQIPKFSIVEFGAGNGRLCLDILNALGQNHELYDSMHYYIVEKNTGHAGTNGHFTHEKLTWLNSPDPLQDQHIEGCVLSNELVDNLPVHRVLMQETLKEVYVDCAGDQFHEVLQDDTGVLRAYFDELSVSLPYGYRTEVNLDAIDWLRTVSSILKKGFLITIDYGYNKDELYSEKRKQGTLSCYYKHHYHCDPYEHIGEQDITADVNFSALHQWGQKFALDCTGFTTQQLFLQSLGLTDYIRKKEKDGKNYVSNHRELLRVSYEFLVKMSKQFKILVQQKSLADVKLRGLNFLTTPC